MVAFFGLKDDRGCFLCFGEWYFLGLDQLDAFNPLCFQCHKTSLPWKFCYCEVSCHCHFLRNIILSVFKRLWAMDWELETTGSVEGGEPLAGQGHIAGKWREQGLNSLAFYPNEAPPHIGPIKEKGC